ncbi:hypothetical protein ACX1C1_07915 [Paenibacillus sp. strain BS8-2]
MAESNNTKARRTWVLWLPIATAYAASKVAAAGCVFLALPLLALNVDLYQMSEMADMLWLGGALQGYAILYSAVVDIVLIKVNDKVVRRSIAVLLHILGGYAPFLFILHGSDLVVSVIAGCIGAACSVAFLVIDGLFRRLRWPYSLVVALLLVAGSIYIVVADF